MNRKIKVLHIISDKNIGGAGILLINLAKSIDKNKFELSFAIPKGSRLIAKLEKEGSVFCFSGKGDSSSDLRSVPSLCRIIRYVSPDIVHTHSSLAGRIASMLCGIKKKARIYTKHCVFEIPTAFKFKLCRILYSIADNLLSGSIVAVATAAKNELIAKGISAKKISVIINGSLPLMSYSDAKRLEVKKRLGISESDFVVGIVARLEEYKGHKTFLKAAVLSKKAEDNIKFIVVGDGSCREELIAFSDREGITDRVIFTGFTENVAEYMNIFDLNINCSTGTETSCLAISEGFSIGIPAIASNFGGNPYMVKNGETGYIFPQNDANELYKIIKSLKNSPETVVFMQKNAIKDYNNRFSAHKMAKNYEKFYCKLIFKSRKTRN